MAREVHRRENLLRDARALEPRTLLRATLNGRLVEVFAGFRGTALSLYFDDDPVFHFNSKGELRRAYAADRLLKAEGRRLVALTRQQSPGESSLVRRDFDAAAQQAFTADLSQRLDALAAAIAADEFDVVGQEPADGDAVPRLAQWLSRHRQPAVAASPRLG
jgi:hypothetical protein